MGFFKTIIQNLESIADRLKSTLNEIGILNNTLIQQCFKWNDISNDNPIKNIGQSPILILEHNEKRQKLIIQNIGNEPCYIKLDGNISTDEFHCVLACDTFESQGNGGSISLENWHGEVYAICENETKISVLEY